MTQAPPTHTLEPSLSVGSTRPDTGTRIAFRLCCNSPTVSDAGEQCADRVLKVAGVGVRNLAPHRMRSSPQESAQRSHRFQPRR